MTSSIIFRILSLMPNRDIRSYFHAFYLHFLLLPRYVPIFWSRREWVKVSGEKISLRRCSSVRVARVDIISGAALMRECRDRRMFTPGWVSSFSLRFFRGSGPAAGCFLACRWCVRIPPFRSAGGSDRRPGAEGAGRKGGRSPALSGLGIAATSGQSIATSSNVSWPVMISSTAARV